MTTVGRKGKSMETVKRSVFGETGVGEGRRRQNEKNLRRVKLMIGSFIAGACCYILIQILRP